MAKTDFLTAFGRLLRDGALRDTYAREPEHALEVLELEASERAAFVAIHPDELEFQAEVLLRKRFELVSRMIPETIANAGDRAGPWFAQYARVQWPAAENPALDDTRGFCSYLGGKTPSLLSPSEQNRVRFATGTARLAIHLVPDLLVRNRRRPAVQLFVRFPHRRWRELHLYFAL